LTCRVARRLISSYNIEEKAPRSSETSPTGSKSRLVRGGEGAALAIGLKTFGVLVVVSCISMPPASTLYELMSRRATRQVNLQPSNPFYAASSSLQQYTDGRHITALPIPTPNQLPSDVLCPPTLVWSTTSRSDAGGPATAAAASSLAAAAPPPKLPQTQSCV
jgi:hypothetical protein